MLIKKAERLKETKQAMRQGPGEVQFLHIANKDDTFNHVKMYANISLKPGCGIGKHIHENECEIITVLKGEADYFDDDTNYKVHEGDVLLCPAGHSHGITNNTKEDFEFIGLIVIE